MWDLHVHTPDSIVQDYKGEAADRWPRFIDELEALPSDLRVLGINDYWFLDGYRRVRQEKESGRLANIDEIFPIIEVRCDTFSGSEGSLKRLNLHLILDPAEPIDDLEQQLGPTMRARYRLTADVDPVAWTEVPTRTSMARLGRKIVESTPPEKGADFAHKSELEIGFNNLNVSFEDLRKGVEDNTYLREHVLFALGKVEWDTIKWNVGSIAHKKTLVNSVQAVFTAAKTREAFNKSLKSLKDAKVRHHLLDCSDAHTWADSESHTRLGYCFTWVNADPTFKGLRQALQEYDQRITVVERPPVLTRVAQAPRSVLTNVTLQSIDDSTSRSLFASSLSLNPGFIVVIGNKGQGKSALLDSIALAANSDRHDDFSFLNSKRFRSAGGVASRYEVIVQWADGSTATAGLNDRFAPGSPIRVDYLPQSLIEKVCSADPNSQTKQEFEAEIERVVFRHIDDATRGSTTSLKQLLQHQGVTYQSALKEARAKIAENAETLSSLQRRGAELEALDLQGRKSALESRLADVSSELQAVTSEIDSGGSAEQQAQAAGLRAAREKMEQVAIAIEGLRQRREAIIQDVTEVNALRDRLRAAIADARALTLDIAQRVGVTRDSLLEIKLEDSAVESWAQARSAETSVLDQSQSQSGGLNDQLAVATRVVEEQQIALQSLNEEAQALLMHQADLRAQADDLLGEPGEPASLRGVEALQTELDGIPPAIAEARTDLHDAARRGHAALSSVKDLQRAAYEPATRFVESNELARDVRLTFDVEFRVKSFTDRWLDMVNRQRLGQFHDMTRHDRDERILDGVDLDNAEDLLAALDGVVDRLSREGGKANGDARSLDVLMRSGHTSADLLSAIYGLDWLHSQYMIRADDAELSELSPGQRGLVLLLFYLLVDKSERPLVLDQPEENLDNQTVRNILVPALREALRRRQIIAVTHNPNFAVVGDADQIIVATFDGHFAYSSGSLAELQIGQSAIDVLEGTREAFASRNVKYTDVVGKST